MLAYVLNFPHFFALIAHIALARVYFILQVYLTLPLATANFHWFLNLNFFVYIVTQLRHRVRRAAAGVRSGCEDGRHQKAIR